MNRSTKIQNTDNEEVTISKRAYLLMLESFCKEKPDEAAMEILSMFEYISKLEDMFLTEDKPS